MYLSLYLSISPSEEVNQGYTSNCNTFDSYFRVIYHFWIYICISFLHLIYGPCRMMLEIRQYACYYWSNTTGHTGILSCRQNAQIFNPMSLRSVTRDWMCDFLFQCDAGLSFPTRPPRHPCSPLRPWPTQVCVTSPSNCSTVGLMSQNPLCFAPLCLCLFFLVFLSASASLASSFVLNPCP